MRRDSTTCSPKDVSNTVAPLSPQEIRLCIPAGLQTLIYKNIQIYMTTFIVTLSFTYLNTSCLTRKLHYLTRRIIKRLQSPLQIRGRKTNSYTSEHSSLSTGRKEAVETCLEKFQNRWRDNKKKLTKSFFLPRKDKGNSMHAPDQAYL